MPTARRKQAKPADGPRALTKAQREAWNRENRLRQTVDQVVITPAQRVALLELIDEHRSIGTVKALRQVGVAGTRGQLAAFVDEDEELQADIREARGYDPERIRSAIAVRAIDGIDEPIVNKDGEIVGYRTIYSDRLLALMAKAHLPEYRDVTRHELTGAGGGPVEVTVEPNYDRILEGLEEIGLLHRGPAAIVEAAAKPVLPARTD